MAIDATTIDADVSGLDTGDVGPADASVKIAHHAHDHSRAGNYYSAKKDNYQLVAGQKIDSPHLYGLYKAKDSAINGSIMLTAFSVLFIGLKEILHAAYSYFSSASGAFSLTELMPSMGLLVTALPAAAITGAIWYGARDYLKHKNLAKEHNQAIDEGRATGLDQTKERERSLEQALEKGGSLMEAEPEFDDLPKQTVEVGMLTKKERPAYLSKILESGPQSLSPSELAERIAQDRAAAQESSRA